MVTTGEIEELIVKLHNDGKNMREISKHEGVHKNFTYIGKVLKRNFPEEYPAIDNCEQIKETEALKFFSEKKTPTEVAIKLGLNFEETEKVYLDFWRLERMYELYVIYCDHKPMLRQVLWFIRQLKKRKGISIKNLKGVLEVLDNNKAIRDELEYFGKNVMPKFLNNDKPTAYNPINEYDRL